MFAHLSIIALLLPCIIVALEPHEDIVRRGARVDKTSQKRMVADKRKLLGDPASCRSHLKACEKSHELGSLDYEGMLGFLDNLNPSQSGAVAQLRGILQNAAGFTPDLLQLQLDKVSDDEAANLAEKAPAILERLREKEQVLGSFFNPGSGEIEEQAIDLFVEFVSNAAVALRAVVDGIVAILPIVDPIRDIVAGVNNFFYNLLLAPIVQLLQADDMNTLVSFAILVIGIVVNAVVAFLITQGAGRRLSDGAAGCVSNLASCQVESFFADNSAALLEIAMIADASSANTAPSP